MSKREPTPSLEVGDRVQMFWPRLRTAHIVEIKGREYVVRFTLHRMNEGLRGKRETIPRHYIQPHPTRRAIAARCRRVQQGWDAETEKSRRGYSTPDPYTVHWVRVAQDGLVTRKSTGAST